MRRRTRARRPLAPTTPRHGRRRACPSATTISSTTRSPTRVRRLDRAEVGGLDAPKNGARDPDEKGSVFGWLGVDKGWDAKRKGREIGSWDKFEEEGEDDPDSGWKGGYVSDEPTEGVPAHRLGDEYRDPRGGRR